MHSKRRSVTIAEGKEEDEDEEGGSKGDGDEVELGTSGREKISSSSGSGGILSWNSKSKNQTEHEVMNVGTNQTILVVANSHNKKKCSLILHGTFFPMDEDYREYSRDAMHALTIEGLFKELHELQQYYLSEVISAISKNVLRARNNIGKGAWKLGFDHYTAVDDEVFRRGFQRYSCAREMFHEAAWNKVETRMHVHNVKAWWQKKQRKKGLSDHVKDAKQVVGIGFATAVGSLRDSIRKSNPGTLRNSLHGSGSGRTGGGIDGFITAMSKGGSRFAEGGGIVRPLNSPANRLKHLKETKEKERERSRSRGEERSRRKGR